MNKKPEIGKVYKCKLKCENCIAYSFIVLERCDFCGWYIYSLISKEKEYIIFSQTCYDHLFKLGKIK